MKFLDIPSLSHLSQALTYDSPECKVFTRLEAYSCKDVRKERKLRKEMEGVWKSEWEAEELSISPEQKAGYLHSPFGLLSEKTSRNLHFLLVSTLNVAFPDYDFSSVRPDEFTRERGAGEVLKALSATVMLNSSGTSPRSYGSYPSGVTSPQHQHAMLPNSSISPPHNLSQLTHPTLHRILNDAIALDECVVYSYIPSAEADPHAEDHDLEGAEDDGEELVDDDDASSEPEAGGGVSDFGFGGMDDDVMMMSMDEDDDDGSVGVPGNTPRKKRSHRRGLRDSYLQSGSTPPPKSSDWESSFEDSGGPPTPGPNRYAPVRARGGLLWSANYFFHCKRQKRILFLSVWARKKTFGFSPPHISSTAYLPPPMVTQPASFQGHSSSSMPSLGYLSNATKRSGAEGMPSLSGIAASFNAASGSSYDHPIRIRGSPTPQPQTSALTASAGSSPLGGAGAIPKLRRQRSASTASTRSTTTDVLNTLSSKAKRVKV